MTSPSPFSTTLHEFCADLTITFPELTSHITRARVSTTPALFFRNWIDTLDILIAQDESRLLTDRKGFIVAAVRLSPAVWGELTDTTKSVIWKYLRTLTLESAMELGLDGMNSDIVAKLMNLVSLNVEERFTPFLDKLKGFVGQKMGADIGDIGDFAKKFGFDFNDLSGFKMPDLPERLRNGLIASLAESLAKQFDPAEFGIDPALLKSEKIEDIVNGLLDLYKKNPDVLINGAKRMAERIKSQILGGILNREALKSEAQEYIELFKDLPLIKTMIGKFTAGAGGGGGAGADFSELLKTMFGGDDDDEKGPSESDRLRAVKERLRKRMASRK